LFTVGFYLFPFLKARKQRGFPVIFPLEGFPMKKRFVHILVQTTPELKKDYWSRHIWSSSYYVDTAGKISAETIRKYINGVRNSSAC